MENIIDATAGAYAASAFSHVVIVDLEVFERAVTLRGAGAGLCLQPGQTAVRPWTPSYQAQGSGLPFGSGNSSIDMGSVRNFKPRPGFYAVSATG